MTGAVVSAVGRGGSVIAGRSNFSDDSGFNPMKFVIVLSQHKRGGVLDVDGENFSFEFIAQGGFHFHFSAEKKIHRNFLLNNFLLIH